MISFVVPAHNEEALIGRTLAAIAEAADGSGEDWELIVVDDASSDATAAIAEASGARVIHVDYRQIARTRNAGASVARGEILIFVDADTIIDAKVVKATIGALRAGAVGGGAALRYDAHIPWHGRLLIWLVRSGMRAARLAAGCYVFSKRDVFGAVGGFDEKLFAGEELALSRALAKQGRVVILRESVLSSGRKLRTHSGWEILRLIGAVTVRGERALHSRDDLDLWYGGRRRE